ncbi:MAG: FkbM family methyltransferase, partial [Armatimonadota bacterium]|nr:FkbM family methyltransferase [Armatimonadota bacterium]
VAFNQAVSNKEGYRIFYISTASDNCGFIRHPSTPVLRQIKVPTTTLKHVLNEHRGIPILIKIDTEGHEIEVLEGIERILEEREDVYLIVEYNPLCLQQAGHEPEELPKRLSALGYDLYLIDDIARDCSRTYTVEEGWYSPKGMDYANLYCVKKSRSLNLAFFSHSAGFAGAERCLLELVTELVQDYGAICTVYLPSDGPLVEELKRAGAVTIVGNYHWWCAIAPMPIEYFHQIFDRSFHWLFKELPNLKKINPDVIISNTLTVPWGAIAAKLLNRPHLWYIHEFGELDHRLKFYQPFPEVVRFISASSNQIVACSRAVRDYLSGLVGSQNIQTIYCYIDIPEKALRANGSSCFVYPDSTRLVIAGYVDESKGQRDAIMAVIELVKYRNRNVELTIVGDSRPEYYEKLKRIVEIAGVSDRIHFLPFQRNVFPIVQSADIVLTCSRNEAFGRVTLEAMLLRKTVIGTNAGGTLELIHDGETGLIYEPGNYLQLAEKIECLIDYPELRLRLAENAYRFAKSSFTRENYGGRFYNLLLDLKYAGNPSGTEVWRMMESLSRSILEVSQ